MGHVYASVNVSNKELSKAAKLHLVVDTGSTYTWIKRATLESLDVVSEDKWTFKTIEGKLVEREIGEVVVKYDDLRATTKVVFGLEEDAEVLGVYTLEGLRLEVDPITKKLKKTKVLLAI